MFSKMLDVTQKIERKEEKNNLTLFLSSESTIPYGKTFS
jgi:hypothetical protein